MYFNSVRGTFDVQGSAAAGDYPRALAAGDFSPEKPQEGIPVDRVEPVAELAGSDGVDDRLLPQPACGPLRRIRSSSEANRLDVLLVEPPDLAIQSHGHAPGFDAEHVAASSARPGLGPSRG